MGRQTHGVESALIFERCKSGSDLAFVFTVFMRGLGGFPDLMGFTEGAVAGGLDSDV